MLFSAGGLACGEIERRIAEGEVIHIPIDALYEEASR